MEPDLIVCENGSVFRLDRIDALLHTPKGSFDESWTVLVGGQVINITKKDFENIKSAFESLRTK